jgi:hypothetical protein
VTFADIRYCTNDAWFQVKEAALGKFPLFHDIIIIIIIIVVDVVRKIVCLSPEETYLETYLTRRAGMMQAKIIR